MVHQVIPAQPIFHLTGRVIARPVASVAPAVMPPAAVVAEAVAQVYSLAERAQLDEAIDYAARVHRATVGEFVAAPSAVGAAGLPHIALAIEFFVPPASADQFSDEVDRALVRRSLGYFSARRTEQVRPICLTLLPAGSFHQWRVVWKKDPAIAQENRWSPHRRIYESILHQAATGWNEHNVVE